MKKVLIIIGVFILVIIVAYIFICFPFFSRASGMSPTINPGDVSIIEKLTKEYKRGDIIAFYDSAANWFHLARIVGLPSEKIEILNNNVYINGSLLKENYALGKTCGRVTRNECPDLSIKLDSG